jgi:Arc/MetJ-type ribon-helix-helix transcriptional regulator
MIYNKYILNAGIDIYGDLMGYINLGTPYETIIDRIIKKGYAGNQTEVIRQALLNYDRYLEEEEARRVDVAIEAEMKKIKSGETKTYPLDVTLKKLDKMHGIR